MNAPASNGAATGSYASVAPATSRSRNVSPTIVASGRNTPVAKLRHTKFTLRDNSVELLRRTNANPRRQ